MIAFLENFKIELSFLNSTNYEKFLRKIPNINKINLIFCSIFLLNITFKLTEKFFQNDHFNFLTCFCDFWLKIIKNISKIFLISCFKIFKLIFLESSAENIENATFHFIQICPCFVSSLLFVFWIIIFATKLRFGKNPSKLFFTKNQENFHWPKLAKLITDPSTT